MKVINATETTSLIPEAVVNVYQGINSITRIFRKTCENVERTADLGFDVMNMTLESQRAQLEQRKALLTN